MSKRHPGGPKTPHHERPGLRVEVRLGPELAAAVRADAVRDNISTAELVRRAVAAYVHYDGDRLESLVELRNLLTGYADDEDIQRWLLRVDGEIRAIVGPPSRMDAGG